jgi:hypothetical protein
MIETVIFVIVVWTILGWLPLPGYDVYGNAEAHRESDEASGCENASRRVPGKNEKWLWKCDYCKSHGLPPAQEWAWQKAEDAFNKKYNATPCGRSSAEGMVETQNTNGEK